MSGLIGKIPAFCCESDEWDEYLELLEQFFLLNDVPTEKRSSLLISVLNQKVYSSLYNLCRPQLPEEKSFNELCQFLQTMYSTSSSGQPNLNVPRSTTKRYNVMKTGEREQSRKDSYSSREGSDYEDRKKEQEEKEERYRKQVSELKRRERDDKRRDMEKKIEKEDREEKERRERRRLLLEAEEREDKKRRLEREKRQDEERRREREVKLAREESLAAELRDRKKQRKEREERIAKEEREAKSVAANNEDTYLRNIMENERKTKEKQAVEEAARIAMYANNVERELHDIQINQLNLEMDNLRAEHQRKRDDEQAKHKKELENAGGCIIT